MRAALRDGKMGLKDSENVCYGTDERMKGPDGVGIGEGLQGGLILPAFCRRFR